MWPYCIDTIDSIEHLLESFSSGGCSTPPPASLFTTVFYTFVYVCVCVRVRESVCVYSTLQKSTESVSQSGNWRKLAIGEDQRIATLVVIVFLVRFVP